MLNFNYIWQNAPSSNYEEFGINVGKITYSDSVDLIMFFNRWCKIISHLIKLQKKHDSKYTKREKILKKYRMCTFEEFEYLHISAIEDEQLPLFHVFKSLDCYSSIERNRYSKKYELTREGYLKFIEENTPKDLLKWIHTKVKDSDQVFPFDMMEAHTYIVAPIKSGKSTLMRHLIYEIQRKQPKCTQIILDPHGELSDDLLRTKNQDIVYLDLDLKAGSTYCLNLFDVPNREEKTLRFASENIVGVLNEVIVTKFSGHQKTVLQNCVNFLLDRGNSTMQDFLNLLKLESTILTEAQEYDYYFADDFTKGVIGRTREATYSRVQELLTRALKPILIGDSTIKLEELINSGKTIIFNLVNLPDEESKPKFGKLLLSYIKNVLFQRGAINNPLPLFLYIDECQVFVSGTYNVLLSQMRKFGVRLILANQYFEQLTDENTKHAIIQNTAIKVVRTSKIEDAQSIARVPEKIALGQRQLKQYEFMCDIWYREPTIFKATDFLVTSNEYYYKDDELAQLKQKQLEKYYKPIELNRTRNTIPKTQPQTSGKESTPIDKPPFDLHLGTDESDNK